jgi:CBS domain-containing protein
MHVDQIMTSSPACCTPESPLDQVARLMLEHDCGEIPIVKSLEDGALVGVITDRDIVCRTVARGLNPIGMTAGECMSQPAQAVTLGTSLEECCRMMESRQIRRMPIVDQQGRICGIVSQADIAMHGSQLRTAELVREVSEQSRGRAAGAR